MPRRLGLASLAITVSLSSLAMAQPAGAPPSPSPSPPSPPSPSPSPDLQRARTLYQEGDTHFRLAEYDQAIEKFKEAYRISPAPGLLFNLAQSYRLKGDCRQAVWFYEKFAHSGAPAADIARADEHLQASRECVARLEAEEAAKAKAPPPPPPPTPPTPPTPTPPTPPTPTAPPPAPRSWKTPTGLGLMAVGAVGLGLGGYFARDASRQADLRDAECNDGDGCTAAAARAFDDAGQASERRAIGLWVAGGVAVAGGVTLYLLGRRASAVVVTPLEGGAAVAVHWRM